MSISFKSSKNDIIYTLNSDVLIYLNEYAANKIELSHIMQKDTPFEDLVVLPFYWKLVVNHKYSTSKKRDKFIYDLLKRMDCLFNIRKVKWMSGVDALLYGRLDLRNLKYLGFEDDFNQPLGDSLQGELNSLTNLTFGHKFNQSLGNSLQGLSSLTHLTFGEYFNQPLGDSLQGLNSLTHLTFGWHFNQPLGDFLQGLSSLTHLTFGDDFNQPLGDSLQGLSSLTHLTFGDDFNQPLGDSLQRQFSLTHLTFRFYFNQPLGDSLQGLSNCLLYTSDAADE